VAIYPNDHHPAHVHVMGQGCEVIVNLNCPDGPVEYRENYGFSGRLLKAIRQALSEHLIDLCRAWEMIHGIAQRN
jgi:hypothetical protein